MSLDNLVQGLLYSSRRNKLTPILRGVVLKNIIIAMLATGLVAQAQTTSTSASGSTTSTTQQSGESAAKIQDLQKKDEQMKDIDQEITNNKLRAELGSKSKWSVRTAMNYQGGTIKKAFSEERPEIRAEGEEDGVVNFSADIAVKYRTSEKTSLNLGTGVSVDRLFHRTLNEATNSEVEKNKRNEDGSARRNAGISDPYIEFNAGYKALGLQNSSAISLGFYTDSFYTDTLGRTNSLSLQHVLIQDIGNNSLGLALAYTNYFYENSSDFTDGGGRRMAAQAYASPFYEYAFNDKYNFRTVFNWFSFNNRAGQSEWTQAVIQQSMGLGISITRDVFLYPNVQFIPQDIRADRTNVALSANINLF